MIKNVLGLLLMDNRTLTDALIHIHQSYFLQFERIDKLLRLLKFRDRHFYTQIITPLEEEMQLMEKRLTAMNEQLNQIEKQQTKKTGNELRKSTIPLRRELETNLKKREKTEKQINEAIEQLNEQWEVTEEIFRAIIVMLHAILEQVLRDIGRLRLPYASAKTLNEIPMADESGKMKHGNYKLGELTNYRSKTGQEIIQESVNAYLAQKNFGSKDAIVKFLNLIGIDPGEVGEYLPTVEEFIARRHRIVHRGDLVDEKNLAPIEGEVMQHWDATVHEFIHRVIVLACPLETREKIESMELYQRPTDNK